MYKVFHSLVFATCGIISAYAGNLGTFNREFSTYDFRGHNSAFLHNNNFYKQRSYDFPAPGLSYQKYSERLFSGFNRKYPVRSNNQYIPPGNKYISPLLPHLNQYIPPKYITPQSIPPLIPSNKYLSTNLPDLPKPNFLRYGSPLLKAKAPEKKYIPPNNLRSKIPINTYLQPPPLANPNRYLPNKNAHHRLDHSNEDLKRHDNEETFVRT